MATKEVRVSTAYTTCDVCGRTLLRGERAEMYVDGGERRSVCELCKPRALNEGWVLEGTLPTYDSGETASDGRRSLLGRLRRRREARPHPAEEPLPTEELESRSWSRRPRRAQEPVRGQEPPREPRHVRAVPTSPEQKVASAIHLFNGSEHPRTVAGVARSLGAPTVTVRPAEMRPSLVHVVVSWELCWYRYEVDLADEVPAVRVESQGSELSELAPEELEPNAVSDDHGSLGLAG